VNIRKAVVGFLLLCGLQATARELLSPLFGQAQTRAAAGTGTVNPPAPAPPAPAPNSLPPLYVIQPNDLLTVFVWREPTLSGEVLVRPDGRITLPLIQDLPAAGLNPGELKEKIEESLKQYVEVPTVTVSVKAIQSYRVFVLGKVNKPGVILEIKPINALQALALAGGFTEFANPDEIVIIRDKVKIDFKYRDVIKAKNFDQNLMLQSGDVVVVP
jgi:polysaccharide export outer membrane protein